MHRFGGFEGLVAAQAALKADLATALAGAGERRAAAADAARRLGDVGAGLEALAGREAALREGVAELEKREVRGMPLTALLASLVSVSAPASFSQGVSADGRCNDYCLQDQARKQLAEQVARREQAAQRAKQLAAGPAGGGAKAAAKAPSQQQPSRVQQPAKGGEDAAGTDQDQESSLGPAALISEGKAGAAGPRLRVLRVEAS